MTSSSCGMQPGEEENESMEWEDATHSAGIASGLLALYRAGELLDITLQGGEEGCTGPELRCHRAVLAAMSPYFRAMFRCDLREKSCDVVGLPGVEAGALGALVEYGYTGRLLVTQATAQGLLQAASLLHLSSVQQVVAQFMEAQLDAQNCVGVHFFALLHSCADLATRAKECLEKNFIEVCEGEEFVQLGEEQLESVISSSELNVEKEETVYEAVVRWARHSPEARAPHLGKLLLQVRFGLIGSTYLVRRVLQEESLQQAPSCAALLADLKNLENAGPAYSGQHEFSVVLRSGMIKPEACMLFIGGVDHNRPSINCYNPVTRETYLMAGVGEAAEGGQVVELEDPACVVTDDNQIFVAGGGCVTREVWGDALTDDACSEPGDTSAGKDLFHYDNDHNRWRRKAPMLFPKSNFALAAVGGRLYCFGGLSLQQQPTEIVECYDIALNRWHYAGMMPTSLVDLQAVAHAGFVYVLGGRTGVGAHNAALRWDPRANEWRSLAGMPTPRFNFGACLVDGELWVAGGQIYGHSAHSISRQPLSSVEVYSITRNQWRLGPELPEPLYNVGLMTLHGALYAAGTAEYQRSAYRVYRYTVVYRLDAARARWSQLEADLSDLRDFRCVGAKLHTRKLSQVFRPAVDT